MMATQSSTCVTGLDSAPGASFSVNAVNSGSTTANQPLSEPTPAELLRHQIRANRFQAASTSGLCPGYAQANLLILPRRQADDFRLLCKRNPVSCVFCCFLIISNPTFLVTLLLIRRLVHTWLHSCPLIGETQPGDPSFPERIAAHCDIRTDVPWYNVYENGVRVDTVRSVKAEWREDSVAFLIGCSYSFEAALVAKGLLPRQIELKRNVPMYKTKIALFPAGRACQVPFVFGWALCSASLMLELPLAGVFLLAEFGGHMVVSMRPYKPELVEVVRDTTRPFVETHGEPVAWGWDGTAALGIEDIHKPDFGDASEFREGEVPVFWGCGVTPQLAVMDSKIPGRVVSHAPGHMLVTDLMDRDVCSV